MFRILGSRKAWVLTLLLGSPRASMSDPHAMLPPTQAAAAGRASDARPTAQTHEEIERGLRGRLNLGDMEIVDDRVQAPIDDGRTAILTIDPDLQERADAILAEANAPSGAIVVMSPDGRILAMSGRAKDKTELAALVARPWAPSASVFKIVTSAALVDQGVGPDARVCYHAGEASVEPDNLTDNRRDDDCNTLAYGVARSQNAILAKLAVHHLDTEGLQRHADLMGYDAVPDVALPVAPSPAEIPSEKADKLEFARSSAGFYHSELSPLAGATLAATVASGGLAVQPRLVDSIVDANGREEALPPPSPFHRAIPEETARTVTQMMVGTTAFGTARNGFHDGRGRAYLPVDVAGKTGTLGKGKLEYSWFVGFAPAEQPKYVVAVVLGNGDDWKLKGHQAARMILETAFTRDRSESK